MVSLIPPVLESRTQSAGEAFLSLREVEISTTPLAGLAAATNVRANEPGPSSVAAGGVIERNGVLRCPRLSVLACRGMLEVEYHSAAGFLLESKVEFG